MIPPQMMQAMAGQKAKKAGGKALPKTKRPPPRRKGTRGSRGGSRLGGSSR